MEVRRIRDDELYHHGVKGQKWGVRRYQNADGSLTPEGSKHYAKTISKDRFLYKDTGNSYGQIRKMQVELHNSKPRPKEDNIDYSKDKTDKGKKYYRELAKQIKNGYVTSFVEDAKMNGIYKNASKTKRGVVVRDKDGNRITSYDYNKAQNIIWKYYKRRVNTGDWG